MKTFEYIWIHLVYFDITLGQDDFAPSGRAQGLILFWFKAESILDPTELFDDDCQAITMPPGFLRRTMQLQWQMWIFLF